MVKLKYISPDIKPLRVESRCTIAVQSFSESPGTWSSSSPSALSTPNGPDYDDYDE